MEWAQKSILKKTQFELGATNMGLRPTIHEHIFNYYLIIINILLLNYYNIVGI